MKPADARSAGLAARRQLSQRYRSLASRTICKRITRTTAYRHASVIGVYLALADEVNLEYLIAHAHTNGKAVCVPVVENAHVMHFKTLRIDTCLQAHALGMLEPRQTNRHGSAQAPSSGIDLICAPMSAFDENLHRTGMGSGFYDRYLAKHKRRIRAQVIGIAFACQQVNEINSAPWDIPMNRVVTERFSLPR